MDELYNKVEVQYFGSRDFNGLPIYSLKEDYDVASDDFKEMILQGIERDIITARHVDNPHIQAFSNHPPKERLLKEIKDVEFPGSVVLYPHEKKLQTSRRLQEYADRPYHYELAKGSGQLDYRAFDLSVLEYYRNDPRFSYETDFINGSISVSDEYYESSEMQESDQIVLKTFGIGYDEEYNRYVVVFLRYLSDLSAEHQNIWKAKEVAKKVKLHPDYYRSSILGDWGTKISIFQAFIMELEIINKMSDAIGRPPLFRETYSEETPKKFGFLLRPTLSEFNDFCLLLDQMMSDNINKKFFQNDISDEIEEERDDGKVIVRPKGTITILEEWVGKFFKPSDPQPMQELFNAFKEVRKLRQKPAHSVNPDKFDQSYFKTQRDLIIKAYGAIRTIRLILSNHPRVKGANIEVQEELYKGEIWDV